MATDNSIIYCCNNSNPITAKITLSDSNLNNLLTQVNTYDSSVNNFEPWVQLKATLPPTTNLLNFDINLQIDTGLNCCCDYELYIDKVAIICTAGTESQVVNDIKCPGYALNKVIDNKKSWVYNPGIAEIGISEYDNIERNDGSFGLIAGEGTINRTFAPSPDADIDWRYTNYFEQSSVYEKHSNLTINSKELWLIFDMCTNCPISATSLVCTSGYTLSANTNVCYSGSSVLTATTEITVTYLTLLQLEDYKKQFQSFWTPFLEQFIPATTVWVAGERWCNEPCPILNECATDLTDEDLSVNNVEEATPIKPETDEGLNISSNLPQNVSSTSTSAPPSGGYTSELPTNSNSTTVTITDVGVTTSRPNNVSQQDANVDMTAYQNRFTEQTTIIQN